MYIEYWNVICTKSGWQWYDKLCEKFSNAHNVHVEKLKLNKSAIHFLVSGNVQLNQSCRLTCLIILRKAFNFIPLLIKIVPSFGYITHLAHFSLVMLTTLNVVSKNFTFLIQNNAFNSTRQSINGFNTPRRNEKSVRTKINSEYVFNQNWN